MQQIEESFGSKGMVRTYLIISQQLIHLFNLIYFIQKLCVPGRELICEGPLLKVCRKTNKLRHFYLFNDLLIYSTHPETTQIPSPVSKLRQPTIIPLESVAIQATGDSAPTSQSLSSLDQNSIESNDDIADSSWIIRTPYKSFMVFAMDLHEKFNWLCHLECTIQRHLINTGLSTADYLAPVWIQDTEVDVCMDCHEQKFSTINRRHHCRCCGRVICSGCSKNRITITSGYSSPREPVRVCDTCYQRLCEQQIDPLRHSTRQRQYMLCDCGKCKLSSVVRDNYIIVPVD